MPQYLIILLAALVGLTGALGAASPAAASHEIVIGVQCDRTGATQIVGTVYCPAQHDYIALVNSKGGVEGHKLKALEVDHEYKVPPAVEAYERFQKDGPGALRVSRADAVIAHLFGGAPAVSIKEFKRVGYPLRKVVSLVWGSAEANIDAAGGFAVAEGYYTMQFAGVGTDYPVLNEIREMYRKQGKPAPKEMASTVFYNRGVLVAALHVEAIRNALKAKPDGKITGADVKAGFEKINNFTLGGLVPPLKITATDHDGGR